MPSATSNARALFEFIENHGDLYQYLSSIPDPAAAHHPCFEEEWLDFKGCPSNSTNASIVDEAGAKKIWSKALSGYANITDGLIIWGIDARKMPPRDIDAASGLRPLPDPLLFESKLRDWIRDATNPPVMGVEYLSIPGAKGDGFVVCLVPESQHKPHRAEAAGKHYYYRAGDDFLVAEPGLLRTLFYPRTRPQLSVVAMLSIERYASTLGELSLSAEAKILVLNNGMHSATNLCVVLDHDQNVYPQSKPGAGWEFLGLVANPLVSLNQQSLHAIAFASKRPHQPGFRALAGTITWKFEGIKD
jgi:hypothetical protein